MTGHRVSPGGPSLIRVNTNHPKGSRLLAETTGGQRRSRNAHGCFRPCVVLRSGRTTENRRPFWSEKRNAEFKPLSTVDTIVCDMTLPLMLCWTCTVPSLIKGMATGSNWKHGASQHPSRFHMGSGTRSHFTPPHGERILGYDNAHAFRQAGKSRGAGRLPARDHRHRHTSDSGTAYEFKSAQQLLEDFFADADRILAELSKP